MPSLDARASRAAARKLRSIADRVPEIAADLRDLADDLDVKARGDKRKIARQEAGANRQRLAAALGAIENGDATYSAACSSPLSRRTPGPTDPLAESVEK
jgi:hypothetical protein